MKWYDEPCKLFPWMSVREFWVAMFFLLSLEFTYLIILTLK